MGSGVIVSEIEPELTNRYTWIQNLPDGSRKWYEPSDGGWQLVKTDSAPATSNAVTAAISTHSAD